MAYFVFAAVVTGGCTASDSLDDGPADINGDEPKADGQQGIEVTARLRPGSVDATLTTAIPRPGYVFYAGEGTKVSLEVTHAGSQTGLDTLIKVYGPRLSDGSYPRTLAADDDSGYGKLSRIKDLEIAIPGFYLVELTTGPAAAAPADNAKARLALSCTGTCDSELPIAPLGLDIKYFQRAAERRALSLQAYAIASAKLEAKAASASGTWGVVLDIDETTLDNSPYQKSRADLGLGYSPATWTTWVNQRAAVAIPGALAFTQQVKQLGGKVVFVSNRLAATECAQTEDNLHAQGFAYDGILCKTTTSDKNPRFDALAQGTAIAGLPALDVVMFVGDNITDFPALTQEIRKQPDAAFGAFGDRFFVLPNPMYGSWEKNAD
ncbi:MAG TPA: HAD family acid phosphatase [Kofleriaceae bacterium]|nr:HAD family acid phosphatase [Kofleriaceae bacterium]